MKDSRFIGTGVALVTPFDNGAVDYSSLSQVIDYVIDGGVDYVVSLGSTGEAATISDEEARQVLDHTVEQVGGRVPIIAGNFGHNDTRALVAKVKGYNFDGIAAILSASPAYVKPTQEGVFQHFMTLADVSPVPIMLYNVPGRTSSNMHWQTTVRLAEASDRFVGIKEASGDLIQTTHLINNKPNRFIVTSGDDELAFPMVALGADGVISVMANVLPAPFSSMIGAALSEDFAKARSLNAATYDLHRFLYMDGNPVGIKAAMEHLGLCSRAVRQPLSAMTDGHVHDLTQALDQILKGTGG